jgi:hypothetical protein
VLKVILAVLYGLCIVPAHVVGRLRKRDSLMLRKPSRESYWLAKAETGDVQSYFAPGSARYGNGVTPDTPRPMVAWVAPLYVSLGRWFAPRRGRAADSASASPGTREQGIPDEIYTLW